MAPEDEVAPEEPEVKKKSSGNLKTIITIAVILLLSAAAGLVMTKIAVLPRLGGSGSGELVGDEEVQTETPDKPAAGGAMIYYDPIELIVNIEDKGIDRFLIVEILLQLETEGLKKELTSMAPRVKDRFISVLRSKTYDDLKGAQGQDRLSRELVETVNALLSTGRVVDADLTKFQVQ